MRTVLALWLFFAVLPANPAWATDVLLSPLVPSSSAEQRMWTDGIDGRFDDISLLEAALLASGVEQPDRRRELARLFESQREATVRLEGNALRRSTEARAGDLLAFLHANVLTGEYSASCTEVDRALLDGDFNCVTASVLFIILARSQGLACEAVARPAHVCCRVQGSRAWIVETTMPSGVRAPGPDRRFREISDASLVGKIYYNRGVAGLERGQFARALRYLRVARLLDPADQAARENILAGTNNWALACCDRGDYERAIEILAEGRRFDDSHEPFYANHLHVCHRWVTRLCVEGRYPRALQVLQEGRTAVPDHPLFSVGRATVYKAWAEDHLAAGRWEEMLEILELAAEFHSNDPPLAEVALSLLDQYEGRQAFANPHAGARVDQLRRTFGRGRATESVHAIPAAP